MAVARVTKDEKKYLVIYTNGSRQRVTIPVGSKVTYAKAVPAGADSNDRFTQGGQGEYCIRIYEGGEGIQLAVIPGVKSFRSLEDIKIDNLDIQGDGSGVWVEDTGTDLSREALKALEAK